MTSGENNKNDGESNKSEPSHPILPKITNDEIDLEIDSSRDDEITRDKPPHHN